MTDGLVFVAIGNKAMEQYNYASTSLKNSHNADYEVQAILGDFGGANKQASRYNKVTMYDKTKFSRFVYLDVDTRPRESLAPLFNILDDGWDIVIVPSSNQEGEAFWHVDIFERQATFEEIGIIPLQLQCGVMVIAKNKRTKALFDGWHDEWRRWSGEDQAAFVRALYKYPVKVWLMGYPWNGGAAIGHNFGALR